jgi:hypothetical protein
LCDEAGSIRGVSSILVAETIMNDSFDKDFLEFLWKTMNIFTMAVTSGKWT